MKKMIFIVIMLILFITVIFLRTKTKESIEGYVYSSQDSSLWVIELEEKEINGGSNIDKLLEAKAANSEGIIFEEAFLNKVTNSSSFKKGDKVKVFWPGGAFQSAPSMVEDTFLIVK